MAGSGSRESECSSSNNGHKSNSSSKTIYTYPHQERTVVCVNHEEGSPLPLIQGQKGEAKGLIMHRREKEEGLVKKEEEEEEEVIVVGYAFMPKKMETMKRIVLQEGGKAKGQGKGKDGEEEEEQQQQQQPPTIEFRAINLDQPLEDQGPFDVILHKLSEDIVHQESNPEAARRIRRLIDYVDGEGGKGKGGRNVVLIEHPRDIEKIVSRAETCRVLRRLSGTEPDAGVRPPRFIVAGENKKEEEKEVLPTTPSNETELSTLIDQAPFTYPLIAKPIVACGTSHSHRLVVVGSPAGLSLIQNIPMVLQEYANHDGVLFKVYVLGETIKVFERRSLPNLERHIHTKSVTFNSQDPYPSQIDFEINHEDDSDEEKEEEEEEEGQKVVTTDSRISLPTLPTTTLTDDAIAKNRPQVSEEKIRKAALNLSKAFNLEIFGFDLIVERETGDLLVVDVNYFPSFKEVQEFPALLKAFLRKKALLHKQKIKQMAYRI